MGLTPEYKAALEQNAEEFLKIVPVNECLNALRFKNILSTRQKEDINRISNKEDKNTKLIEILLEERDNEDLRKFCKLLQENNVRAVKAFGSKLLADCEGTIPDLDINGNPTASCVQHIEGGNKVDPSRNH